MWLDRTASWTWLQARLFQRRTGRLLLEVLFPQSFSKIQDAKPGDYQAGERKVALVHDVPLNPPRVRPHGVEVRVVRASDSGTDRGERLNAWLTRARPGVDATVLDVEISKPLPYPHFEVVAWDRGMLARPFQSLEASLRWAVFLAEGGKEDAHVWPSSVARERLLGKDVDLDEPGDIGAALMYFAQRYKDNLGPEQSVWAAACRPEPNPSR